MIEVHNGVNAHKGALIKEGSRPDEQNQFLQLLIITHFC